MTKLTSILTAALATPLATTNGFTSPTRNSILPRPSHTPRTPQTLQATSTPTDEPFALLFDCDGVIIETEELHRLAYNAAFEKFHLKINEEPVEWTVPYYDILQNTVGGGKNKMFFHFRNTTGAFPTFVDVSDDAENGEVSSPPATPEQQQELIDKLQLLKTDLYKQLIAEKAQPRPGVLQLMDQALADPSLLVGVCSASTKAAVTKVLDVTLGEERRNKLDVCILGEDVERLKPDPMIYETAAERLGVKRERCVVIEDSVVGLKAAKGAGMRCLITYTSSTENEDFYGLGADAKVPDLGSRGVDLDMIFGPLRSEGLDAEILKGVRD